MAGFLEKFVFNNILFNKKIFRCPIKFSNLIALYAEKVRGFFSEFRSKTNWNLGKYQPNMQKRYFGKYREIPAANPTIIHRHFTGSPKTNYIYYIYYVNLRKFCAYYWIYLINLFIIEYTRKCPASRSSLQMRYSVPVPTRVQKNCPLAVFGPGPNLTHKPTQQWLSNDSALKLLYIIYGMYVAA